MSFGASSSHPYFCRHLVVAAFLFLLKLLQAVIDACCTYALALTTDSMYQSRTSDTASGSSGLSFHALIAFLILVLYKRGLSMLY